MNVKSQDFLVGFKEPFLLFVRSSSQNHKSENLRADYAKVGIRFAEKTGWNKKLERLIEFIKQRTALELKSTLHSKTHAYK